MPLVLRSQECLVWWGGTPAPGYPFLVDSLAKGEASTSDTSLNIAGADGRPRSGFMYWAGSVVMALQGCFLGKGGLLGHVEGCIQATGGRAVRRNAR